MKPFLFLLVLLLFVPAIRQENGLAQSKADLVGTWKLISVTDTTDKGQVIKDAYGQNPTGFLTYTADGRMMAIITNGGRKSLSVRDRVSAPAEERAKAFSTMVAYGGRYTVEGDEVIHHVEVAAMQNNGPSADDCEARTQACNVANAIFFESWAAHQRRIGLGADELEAAGNC
jgi:hypothetical protein